MPYASIDDVFAQYTPIKTMVGSQENDIASTDITSKFIPRAQGVIDSFIGAKYVTPLAEPVPEIITHIAADLAIFNLAVEKLPRAPDFMKDRYDRAMEMLRQLRDGGMVLPGSVTAVSGGGNNEAWSPTTGHHPVFSPVLDDKDQRADQDYIEDERGERFGDRL